MHFDIAGATSEAEKLEAESAQPDFWNDMENSQKVLQKIKQLKAKIQSYEGLETQWEDTLILIDLANEENDESMLDEVTNAVKSIKSKIDTMTLETLLSGQYDSSNAIITLHGGAGLVSDASPNVSDVGAEKRI